MVLAVRKQAGKGGLVFAGQEDGSAQVGGDIDRHTPMHTDMDPLSDQVGNHRQKGENDVKEAQSRHQVVLLSEAQERLEHP